MTNEILALQVSLQAFPLVNRVVFLICNDVTKESIYTREKKIILRVYRSGSVSLHVTTADSSDVSAGERLVTM